MAHTKAGKKSANQGSNVAGKRLGTKVSGGCIVRPGQIIVRQRGRTFVPGENVGMGRDFTLFSKIQGVVEFKYNDRKQKRVDVIPKADL